MLRKQICCVSFWKYVGNTVFSASRPVWHDRISLNPDFPITHTKGHQIQSPGILHHARAIRQWCCQVASLSSSLCAWNLCVCVKGLSKGSQANYLHGLLVLTFHPSALPAPLKCSPMLEGHGFCMGQGSSVGFTWPAQGWGTRTRCTQERRTGVAGAGNDPTGRCHTIMWSQNGWGWKGALEIIYSNLPAQAGSLRACYSGLYPSRCWIPPVRETTALLAICSTAQSPAQ